MFLYFIQNFRINGSILLISFFVICLIKDSNTSNLNVFCSINADCEPLFGKDVICENNHCICATERGCRNVKSSLEKVTEIGATCVDDDMCNIDNAICAESSCQCKPEYIKSKDGKTCLAKAAGLLQKCQEDPQCTAILPNSYCNAEKRCNCSEGFRKSKFSCYKMMKLREPCSSDAQCDYIQDAICNQSGLCLCRPSANNTSKLVESLDGSRCLPAAKTAGNPCQEELQCQNALGEGAICKSEICDCAETHSLVDGTCQNKSRLNKACKTTEDCRNLDGSLIMECATGICKCSAGYMESDDICISSARAISSNLFLFLGSLTSLYLTSKIFK